MGWLIRALTIRTTTARKKFLGNESSFVIVHGDTLSTMVGALIGRRLGLSVAHVEAGLRSPRLLNPFQRRSLDVLFPHWRTFTLPRPQRLKKICRRGVLNNGL